MKVTNSLLLFILVFFTGCRQESNDIKDDSEIRYRYFKFENNGWKSKVRSQKINEINYTATEVPVPYYILKDQGTDNLFDVDSVHKANINERIIEFEFLHEEEKDLLHQKFTHSDFETTIKYLSFSIGNDFCVVTTKHDTIKCSGAIYERQFKLSPTQKIILFFSGINQNEQIQLIYNDRLFNQDIIKFQFSDKPTKILL